MRETIARALCAYMGKDPEELVLHPASKAWDPPSIPAWEWWTGEADAILSAIEAAGCCIAPVEPTEEMLVAGEIGWMNRNLSEPESEPIGDCYRAMIAARPKQ